MPKVIGSYENVADNYDNIVDNKPFHLYYERPNLIKHLATDLQGKEVLDLGCGTGWYAQTLKSRGANIIALDVSKKMVEKTTLRLEAKGKFVVHDLNDKMEFISDNSIDLVVAPLVIHYIANWQNLFQEMARTLKKGGELVISTHQPQLEITKFELKNYFTTQLLHDVWEDIGEVEYYHHSLNDLFSSIKSAGLFIKTIEEPQPLDALKQVNKELFAYLSTQPCLLFMVLVKS